MRAIIARLAAAALIVVTLPLSVWSAEAVLLKHNYSLYADEKGAGFKEPEGVACSADRLVVADSGNGRLVLYSLQAGDAKGGTEVKLPQLLYPVRVAIGKADIFVLDERLRKVARLSLDGVFKQYVDLAAAPTTESMILPAGIAVDRDDNLYVLDILGARVILFNAAGGYVKQINFPKQYGFMTDLAVDSKGTVYVVDAVNAVVYSTAADPAVFSPISAKFKDDLRFGSNIAADSKGLLFISDQNGGGLVAVGQDGTFRNRMLSLGWKEGNLRYPAQLCVDSENGIFVADRANNRVMRFAQVK